MGAKAIVAWDSNGPIVGAAVSLNGHVFLNLTNKDGYSLDEVNPYPAGEARVVVIANGHYSYVQDCVLDGENQNICCGSPASGNDVALPALTFKQPSKFKPMDTYWKGNDCGIHLDYLPPVEGGAPDSTLFVAWMYPRYPKEVRDRIRPDYAKHFSHIALSWPDDYDWGYSASEALAIYQEWDDTSVQVGVFLTAKDSGYDHDVNGAFAFAQKFLDVAVGIIPCFINGWEESLFLTTEEIWELARLIADVVFNVQPETLLYIHLQEGYMGFPLPDHDEASFWWPLQGLVHGVLLQRRLGSTDEAFASWLQDCLSRFYGEWNMPPTNGINSEHIQGVGFELNYEDQYWGRASTEDGNHLGDIAIAQVYKGISIMGSNNGYTSVE